MAKQKHFVKEHLEGVAKRGLKDSSAELKELLFGKHGLYALYKNDKLYYVGLAKNLFRRLQQHGRDRHKNNWTNFSVYVTKNEQQMKELESLALRIISPKGNRTSGRFAASKGLKKQYSDLLTYKARLNQAELLGGKREATRRKRVASKSTGKKKLSALSGKRMKLWADCKGVQYHAVLHKDGTVRYDGQIFNSLSGAAKAALGRSSNGWYFWRYKNKDGKWERMKHLK